MKHNIRKSIFCTLLLLLGVSHAAWGIDLYLVPNSNWLQANARFAVYAFKDGGGKEWYDMTVVNGATNIYWASIDDSKYSTVIFCRMNPGATANDWGNKWNQTGNLVLADAGPNNCYTINDGSWDTGTWSTYGSAGGGNCTVSAAPDNVVAGTNVMFYVHSYDGSTVTIGTSDKNVEAAKSTNVANGISYINIAKTSLTDNTYITDNPGGWNGVRNAGIASAKGGEYFVGNSSTSTTAAKTATTTTTINGNTLNISTTASSAKGVYNDLQLYIQYYIDATFVGVTYSGEEATYCSIKASTSAVSSTYDISSLSNGEHTLLTVLTDGNIYYIADTDNFSVGCTTPTIAWSTAPAGGTAGGSMTAAVSTNQTSPTVTWTSSNTGVATVDANGVITYKAAGTTTITASYTGDGSTYCAEEVSVSQEITVEAAPVWKIKGTFDDWKEHILVDNGDNTCSYTYDLSAASDYTFVIFSGDTYYKGGVITSSNHENLSLKTSGNDNKITTVASGIYTFIWNYSTKQLTVTYPVPATYAVTISAGTGGSVSPSGEQQVGSTAVAIEATPETGYAFDNWAVTGGATVASTSSASTTVTATAAGTVTANFKTASYLVDYHANGHGTAPADVYVNHGGTAPIPTPPTADGYTFVGWYTERECTNAYNFETPVTAELHLYAKWTQNASAVTYYFMGNITGWGDGKGRPMTSEAEYAYIKLSDNQAGKNFKIYNANLNNDAAQYLVGCDTTLFDAECGMDESYKGDIALGPESGGSHHNIQMPASAPSACIVYLYYPNTSINPSSGYVVTAKSIQPQDKAYYFMSDKTKWGEGKGKPLTIDGSNVYAYIQLTAADVAKFKVFEENNNNNSTVYYGGENINNGFNGSNIKLGNDTEWHNATVTDEVTTDWFVILYFPNTPINTTNNYYVCASYTKPVVSDPYPVTFGVVDNIGGTLTAKSGNSTIASGSSVNVATFT
ncbi:MAG: InlB B-repeat-containing protein, partial [Bacteroidales bacterium]|nr:InlB B-repeat-containing protein [Bacteroidales bacterium]